MSETRVSYHTTIIPPDTVEIRLRSYLTHNPKYFYSVTLNKCSINLTLI